MTTYTVDLDGPGAVALIATAPVVVWVAAAVAVSLSAASALHDYRSHDYVSAGFDLGGAVGFGLEARSALEAWRLGRAADGAATALRGFRGAKVLRRQTVRPLLRDRRSWAARAARFHTVNSRLGAASVLWGGYQTYNRIRGRQAW